MKKLIAVVLIILGISSSYSQTHGSYIEFIEHESIIANLKKFQLKSGSLNNFPFKSFSEIFLDIFINQEQISEKDKINVAFYKKNKTYIQEYLDKSFLKMYYQLPDSSDMNFDPLPFGIIKDGNRNIFYQNWMVYDKTLNKAKLNGNERLRYVLNEAVIPFIDNFKDVVKIPEITHFSIMYIYLTEDFTEDYPMPDSEVLFLLIPKQDIIKYLNLEITSEELINNSTTYARSDVNSMKKVSVL